MVHEVDKISNLDDYRHMNETHREHDDEPRQGGTCNVPAQILNRDLPDHESVRIDMKKTMASPDDDPGFTGQLTGFDEEA